VDKTSISATAAAGSYAIIVTSNLSWDATVSEDAKGWCTIETGYSGASNNGTIAINISENLLGEERVATITIRGGALSETVTLTQSASENKPAPDALSVDTTNIAATATAGNYTISVTSNVSWNVTISSDASGWWSINRYSGTGNNTIVINIPENFLGVERVATITIKSSKLSAEVTLTQAAAEQVQESFTMTTIDAGQYNNIVSFDVIVQYLYIDWGDGSTNRYDYLQSATTLHTITHTYPSGSGAHTITVLATTLRELKCYRSNGGYLTSLDVSGCTKLTNLNCPFNDSLTNLNVNGCIALLSLNCDDCALTSLDVSTCTALTSLSMYAFKPINVDSYSSNKITSLDVRNNTELTELSCGDNLLTNLDVSKNTKLVHLGCGGNELTSLDVSNNTALNFLSCGSNQLTDLDISHNPALNDLRCFYNQLSADALNTLFTALPVVPASVKNGGAIYIYGNPGANTCNKTIAMLKNWDFKTN
jgi:hypothetical protein